jgi:hypothetical protein
MGMRPTDYVKTEEEKKLNELRKLDQGVADYIEITLDHLMDYGMTHQQASKAIIEKFKRVLNIK